MSPKVDEIIFVVKAQVDIPEYIGMEIRCYDPYLYMFTKKPQKLRTGESAGMRVTVNTTRLEY